MDSEMRKELWKQISNHERQAVQLIADAEPHDGLSENFREAHRLFAQATTLKASDPYIQLAAKYSEATKREDASESDRLLAEMSAVGLPPHVSALAKQVAQASAEGSQADRFDDDHDSMTTDSSFAVEEEVDPGSVFSDTVTDKIRVKVSSFYDAKRSEPGSGKYMFYYKVAIFNEGSEPVQLVARLWEIDKCRGARETVRGIGVMGTQPIIAPGEVFNYESVCPLKIFPPRGCRVLGSMSGAYTMCKGNMGQHSFTVRVAKFNLILPESAVS